MAFNYCLQIYNIYFIKQSKNNIFLNPTALLLLFYLISLTNKPFCSIILPINKSLLLYEPNQRQTNKNNPTIVYFQ